MSNPPVPPDHHGSAHITYRRLVSGLGLLGLVIVTWLAPGSIRFGPVLLLAIFCAFLVNFPLRLLHYQFNLAHIIALGGSLLFGLPTTGWAIALSLPLSYGLRRLKGRPLNLFASAARYTPLEAGYILGSHVLSLLAAFLPFGALTGSLFYGIATHSWLQPLPFVIAFAIFHGAMFLVDFSLVPGGEKLLLPDDLFSLILLELVPLPIVLIIAMAYPAVGYGALILLGAIPAVGSMLLSGMSETRSGLLRRLQEFSTLYEVSQALRAPLDLENLLSAIHGQVTKLLGVDNFYVALLKSEDNTLWYPLAVKHGVRQQWGPRGLEDRLTDRVIRERKPLLFSARNRSIGNDIRLPISLETPTAWIGVPLISNDRAIGCLALFSLLPQAEFSQDDVNLLTILSGQVCIAIENTLLYEQLQTRLRQLETLNRISTLITASLDPQEVLAQVCRSVTEVGGSSRSAIFLLDTDESEVWLAHAHELSEKFVQANAFFSMVHDGRTRCLRTGKPILSSQLGEVTLERDFVEMLQEEGIRAYGDFPLVTPEGQIGYLSVYFNEPHDFQADEVELLQTYASQAALAVSNARLHARTDLALSQRVHQLSILESVGRELSAAIHSERLFEMILNYALEFTNSRCGAIGLYHPEGRQVEVKASKGYPEEVSNYSVDKGISGKAIRTQQVINCGEVSADPDYQPAASAEMNSQLSIPLAHEGRVLGVLTLESEQPNQYTASDAAFLSQLANQAAIALVNAELYTETQRRLREQSTLYLVSLHLAGAIELESVVNTLQRAIQAALPAHEGGIYLWDEVEQVYSLQPGWTDSPPALPARLAENTFLPLGEGLWEPELTTLEPGRALPKPLARPAAGRRVVFYPLVVKGERLGLAILFLPSRAALKEDELQLLRSILAQGAISLQNALLFSDVTHGRDRLAAILNSVRDGIMMIESNGRIMLVNEMARSLTGLLSHHLHRKPFVDLPPHVLRIFGYTPQEAQELVNSLDQGTVQAGEKATIQIGEGTAERVLERNALPVWGRGGRAIGWMLVVRDVTEEVQVAQAREMITETLVHDLRSPLSAVIGALDVIKESLANVNVSPISNQALTVAHRGATRLLGLVESLLDISRMESGAMEMDLAALDVHLLVEAALGEYLPQANEYGVILRNEVSATLPAAYADASKIQRVLTNLIDNALKFTPSGGQVVVSAGPFEDGMLSLKVQDNGPGVPKEFREKIFERFTQVPGQRSRRRGSGLGLTFCRLAVEANGGRIWVEERPGGGSQFIFTLPQARPHFPKGK